MSQGPKPVVRRAVTASKFGIVAVLSFVVVSALSASVTQDVTTGGVAAPNTVPAAPAGRTHLDKLISRHDCSTTGLEADAIPSSSLVLKGDKVRHVSFDDGWAIYTGERPGTLLAVCRVAV